MEQGRLQKIFGIGPKGAGISIGMFVLFFWLSSHVNLPILKTIPFLLKVFGIILILAGLGLHIWSFRTLKSWWSHDQLCTRGPFQHFKHPMYASWISFACPGIALFFNSWVFIAWVVLLHPVWHWLIKKEEAVMQEVFGDAYEGYSKRTGRFLPKLF